MAPPAGADPATFRSTGGCSTVELRGQKVVRLAWIEQAASSVSGKRSAAELEAHECGGR